MPTRKQLDAKLEDQTHYEIWWGGTDFRHVKANTEEDARDRYDEFAAEGHPNIEIHKVTTTREVIE